jgi:hypothetical protein
MRKSLPLRDLETLSAYLDGQLSPRHMRRLETRLKREPDLQEALEDFRQARRVLRSVPRVRRLRNFTLTPEMVRFRSGRRAATWRGYKVVRFVAVAASVMLAAVFAGELFLGSRTSSGVAFAPAAAPVEEFYSSQDMTNAAGGEAAEEAEAPLAMGAPELEAPQERAADTETGVGGGAPAETEGLGAAAPKAAIEETTGEETMGEGTNALEATGTPTPMGTPIQPEEMEAPTEAPSWAADTTQLQEVQATGEPAPADNAAAPPEEHFGAIEEKGGTTEAPMELAEPRVRLPLIRIVESGLILVALISGGLAIYLRRRAG